MSGKKEDLITENSKEKEVKEKSKRVSISWWISIFILTVIGSVLISFIILNSVYYSKEIKAREKESNLKTEFIKDITKQRLDLIKQLENCIKLRKEDAAIKEENSSKDKKNHEMLVSWVYKNSSKISKKTAEEIVNYTLQTNFPLMHLSIMKTESSFDPTSVSSKGASGIGQQMPKDYEKRLIEAEIIIEWRDIFNVSQGIKATEFAWNDKFQLAEGNVLEALKLYYGDNDKKYIEQILVDYHYLIYLCNFNGLDKNSNPEENNNKTNLKIE